MLKSLRVISEKRYQHVSEGR